MFFGIRRKESEFLTVHSTDFKKRSFGSFTGFDNDN